MSSTAGVGGARPRRPTGLCAIRRHRAGAIADRNACDTSRGRPRSTVERRCRREVGEALAIGCCHVRVRPHGCRASAGAGMRPEDIGWRRKWRRLRGGARTAERPRSTTSRRGEGASRQRQWAELERSRADRGDRRRPHPCGPRRAARTFHQARRRRRTRLSPVADAERRGYQDVEQDEIHETGAWHGGMLAPMHDMS